MNVILVLLAIYMIVICPLFAIVQIGLTKPLNHKSIWILAILIVGPLAAIPYFILYGKNPITKYIHSGLMCLLIVLGIGGFIIRDKIKALYEEKIQLLEQLQQCPDGEICMFRSNWPT